jgi:hypothetical protein
MGQGQVIMPNSVSKIDHCGNVATAPGLPVFQAIRAVTAGMPAVRFP